MVQQSTSACTFLGLSSDTVGNLEVYSLSGLYWQARDAGDVFSVSKNALLLFRRPGVSYCHGLDDAISEARDRLRPPSSVPSPIQVTVVHAKPARSTGKRPREEYDSGSHDACPPSVPRLTLHHSSPFAPSMPPPGPSTVLAGTAYLQDVTTHRMPSSLPGFSSDTSIPTSPPASSSPSTDSRSLSPVGLGFLGFSPWSTIPTIGPTAPLLLPLSSPPSPMLAVIPSPPLTSVHPASPGNADTMAPRSPINIALDASPDPGSIHIPPSAFAQWPKGMYACDLARGFRLMASSTRTNLKEKFQNVFQQVEFKSNTVYRHYNAWRLSTEAEREMLLTLPRTAAGLYKPHGKKLSGWTKVQ